MNMRIISLKCLLVVLALCSSLYASDDVETVEEILHAVEQIAEKCSQKCSACEEQCIINSMKRHQNYLTRKYTAYCQGFPFKETFNVNPTPQEMAEELRQTNESLKAIQARNNIAQCVDAKKRKHTIRMREAVVQLLHEALTKNAQ